MRITIQLPDGRMIVNTTPEDARAAGVAPGLIGSAAKAVAETQVATFAEKYRARLATVSAGKLAEYRIKEEIARDPAGASDAELAMLDREAAARGIDREALLADISAKAVSYRQIALLIGALEAEAKAAIAALADDAADIEDQVQAVLADAQAQAQTAFAEAQAMLAG